MASAGGRALWSYDVNWDCNERRLSRRNDGQHCSRDGARNNYTLISPNLSLKVSGHFRFRQNSGKRQGKERGLADLGYVVQVDYRQREQKRAQRAMQFRV